MEKEILVPSKPADALPGLGLGDLIRYEPIIAQVVTTIEAAVAGGSTSIPAIKFRLAGKRLTLGPTPLLVE